VSGPGATSFVAQLQAPVLVHATLDGFEVRAAALGDLTSALRGVSRPAEKVRVAVR
jgi:hypothetical protein